MQAYETELIKTYSANHRVMTLLYAMANESYFRIFMMRSTHNPVHCTKIIENTLCLRHTLNNKDTNVNTGRQLYIMNATHNYQRKFFFKLIAIFYVTIPTRSLHYSIKLWMTTVWHGRIMFQLGIYEWRLIICQFQLLAVPFSDACLGS